MSTPSSPRPSIKKLESPEMRREARIDKRANAAKATRAKCSKLLRDALESLPMFREARTDKCAIAARATRAKYSKMHRDATAAGKVVYMNSDNVVKVGTYDESRKDSDAQRLEPIGKNSGHTRGLAICEQEDGSLGFCNILPGVTAAVYNNGVVMKYPLYFGEGLDANPDVLKRFIEQDPVGFARYFGKITDGESTLLWFNHRELIAPIISTVHFTQGYEYHFNDSSHYIRFQKSGCTHKFQWTYKASGPLKNLKTANGITMEATACGDCPEVEIKCLSCIAYQQMAGAGAKFTIARRHQVPPRMREFNDTRTEEGKLAARATSEFELFECMRKSPGAFAEVYRAFPELLA